jgi:hypothetical protein
VAAGHVPASKHTLDENAQFVGVELASPGSVSALISVMLEQAFPEPSVSPSEFTGSASVSRSSMVVSLAGSMVIP